MSLGSTGREWKIYRNTGTYSVPVWTAVTERRDISMPLTKDQIEQLRDGAEFKEFLKGFKDLGVSFGMTYRRANANHVAFRTDMYADDDGIFDLLILDGPQSTSGSQGIRLIGILTDFTHSAPLADGTEVGLEFKPTYHEDGGSPVETDWHIVS